MTTTAWLPLNLLALVRHQLLLAALLLAQGAAAQRLENTVVDSASATPIPFATVGVLHANVGTVADGQGHFALEPGGTAPTATVVVSCAGYAPRRFALAALRARREPVRLRPLQVDLPEAAVTAKGWKARVLGRDAKGGLGHFNFRSAHERTPLDRVGREGGAIVRVPGGQCVLDELHFYVEQNEFRNVKFRLNLYTVKNGLPDSLLVHDDIRFDVTNQQTGWIRVDLRQFNLHLRERHIAATLQWLTADPATPKGQFLGIPAAFPSAGHIAVTREKSAARWQKFGANLSLYFTAQCAR